MAILVAGGTIFFAQAPSALATLTVAYDAGSVTVTESAPFRGGDYSATNTSTPPGHVPQAPSSRLRLWSRNISVWGFPSDTAIGAGCKYVFGGVGVGLGNSIECGDNDKPVTSVKWELGEGGSGLTVTDTLNVPLTLELGGGDDAVTARAPPAVPVTADGGPGTGDRIGAYCQGASCPATGVTLTLSGGAVSGIPNLTATNFEGLMGSEGPDTLTGSASPALESFLGWGGNDVINDGGGPDFINGGNGDDTIRARDGEPDTIFCGEGVDTVEADVDGPAPLDSIMDQCEIVNAPPPPPSGCGTRRVQVRQATVEGALAETAPGSGVFRAGPGDVVYAGGFELRPRPGGELLVNPGAGTLAEVGAGVDVHLGAIPVPLGVAAIPVGQADATVALNRDGTLLKALFSLPISGQLKAAWADGGRAAALELELEAEKLLGSFGTFQSGAVGGAQAPSLKIQARQVNCTGFDLTGAEVKAEEISFIPTALKVPRKIGLKNVLFKYEDRGGRDFWTGQGELLLPISASSPELAVGGRVAITDSKLAGVGVSVSGINRRLVHGFFLQSIAGEVAFEPSFGASFVVDGTFGPQVRGKKLASFGGSFKLFALATDCTSGQDPIALGFTASIPVVEDLGAGSIKYEGLNCLYATSLAFEQTGKIDATLGQVVGGQVPNPVVAVKANLSGFVGESRLSVEGGGSVTLPLIGELGGQVLLSTRALAACARIGFFAGGAAHVWGQATTSAFSGCDLAPWRSAQPAASSGLGVRAHGAGAPRAAITGSRSASVDLPAGLPLAGLAVEGVTAPPRVRVLGPRGERVVSQAGKALVSSGVVIVPVAAERRTFVFVRRPSAGRWRVETLGGERLRGLRTAQGLPAPRVSGVLERDGAAVALRYEVAPLRGQEVTFIERTRDGVAKELGRAGGRSGRLRFTPASTGQDARIEASVVQDGFPRATVDIAHFRATAGKAPAAPARVRARRAGLALALSWPRVTTATRYRIDVLQGARRIARRTTTKTRLRLTRVPATALRVQVRAIGPDGIASTARSTTVRRARPRPPAPAERYDL